MTKKETCYWINLSEVSESKEVGHRIFMLTVRNTTQQEYLNFLKENLKYLALTTKSN